MQHKSAPGSEGLAGRTLEALRKEYQFWLFEDFLPFVDKFVVDHEHGGFMCEADRDGTNLSGKKRTWYEGRGIWVYSFLYNELDASPTYLEIARKSVDFILKHNPVGPDLLPRGYHRNGTPLVPIPDSSIYGDLFVAIGLQEFAKASGEFVYWDMAKNIVLKCMDIYDHRSGYESLSGGDETTCIECPRILGHWFVLIHCTTQMLAKHEDPAIREINNRCVEAILNRHVDPETGLMSEYLLHDFSRIRSPRGQLITGHAIEACWMALDEATRRGDDIMFDKAANYLRRHIEVMWDTVFGGLFLAIKNVNEHHFDLRKALWLQEEALIGTLMVIERCNAAWAREWFSRIYAYVLDKFPLASHGYPLWILYADRRVSFEPHTNRVGNYHHPRHLMLNLLCLNRMIEAST